MRCHRWEKIFAKYLSRTGLLSKIHEKLKKLNKKLNNLNKNGPKPSADTSPQKIYRRQINIGMMLHSTCCQGNTNSISNLTPAHAGENDWRSTTWEYPVLGGRSRGMSPVTALLRAACVSPWVTPWAPLVRDPPPALPLFRQVTGATWSPSSWAVPPDTPVGHHVWTWGVQSQPHVLPS